ncbi:hypothetical protein [Erythrobacter sp. BLCC-B19]|uniref:hypothetical protein n=1 Tax=Erythrobacter sp. BLCC-B19 TaxID=3025315 RepID=UPI00235EF208|nr:hypothetical protein [Erythrobacter sp. BLCC-B19]WDA42585.1 hypothetical protein PS060_07190 [Erythrobacter sp. BLCC-B19]
MTKTRVVVEGGGRNLYRVDEVGGVFKVYKDEVWGSGELIGTSRSMNDALDRITGHSGRKIKSIG